MSIRSGGRIGILGGTFDPPHIGHLATAVNVRHALGLDRIVLMVANDPWQKRGTRAITPAEDRLAMVDAAVSGLVGVEAGRQEVDRGGPSYTADTLAQFRAEDPGCELFVVVGRDAAGGLATWERADEVTAGATVVVVDRPGVGAVGEPPAGSVSVNVPHLDVSSSDLRARLGAGRPVDVLLPPAVIDCIAERGLYRD